MFALKMAVETLMFHWFAAAVAGAVIPSDGTSASASAYGLPLRLVVFARAAVTAASVARDLSRLFRLAWESGSFAGDR